jgi:prevent-host-death family protein
MIKNGRIKTNVVSALAARSQFGQIIARAAEKSERFVVGRRGTPTVVIMSIQDYVDTLAPAPQWLRDIQAASKRRGTGKMSLPQINRVIAESRRSGSKKP